MKQVSNRVDIINKWFLMILFGFQMLFFGGSAYAEKKIVYDVDLYRSTQFDLATIKKYYASDFEKIAKGMLSGQTMIDKKGEKIFEETAKKIKDDISKRYPLDYARVTGIWYPDKVNKIYFTLDVLDPKNESRWGDLLPKPTGHIEDPDHLIASWNEYAKINVEQLYKTRKITIPKKCPAFHCLYGFPASMKKYQTLFDEKVPRDKEQLVAILRNDADNEKRATAAFLLAHLKDANELMNILIPSMHDSDEGVRNNAMRVLGQLFMKVKPASFPFHELVVALDRPTSADRNKALFMIEELQLHQPKQYREQIINEAGPFLLMNLKMKQPNLRDAAYQILKRASGKSYKENDYIAWNTWLEKAMHSNSKK